jgi:ArsR family transcriptional regulator
MNDIEFTKACRAFGDDNRLKIVKLLAHGEKCGCDLLAQLNITQPTLSHHMKILIESTLVSSTREGKWFHYKLNSDKLAEFKWYVARIER